MRRRDLLKRGALLAGLGASACILPDRPGPRVQHPVTPLGRLPRLRGSPGILYAGAAQVDITPPPGAPVWLAGYGFQRRMHQVHDPISARALYLDDGVRAVALVVADLVGLLHNSTRRVRRLLGPGVQTVVASTHNHQSPDTMGYWGPAILHTIPARTGLDVAYQGVLERRLAQAVAQAAWSARPAKLAVGRAPAWAGGVKNLRDPADVPTDFVVAELRARTSGQTICSLVNFACHPETLGPRAHLLSADYPGPLRAEMERRRGGICLFINGALGGMLTPNLDDAEDLAARLQFVQTLGQRVAKDAAETLADCPAQGVEQVAYGHADLELASDNDLFHFIERTGLIEARARGAGGAWLSEMGRLDLGPLSFAVAPGEPTPAVGRMMQDKLQASGAEVSGVVGLGNDELGYLLTPAQFDDPAFSYEVSVSPGRGTVSLLMASLDEIQSKRASSGS